VQFALMPARTSCISQSRLVLKRHWLDMVELERLSPDPARLDKAIRVMDRLAREANGKQRGKKLEETLAARGLLRQ
jgi:hypothetical protein